MGSCIFCSIVAGEAEAFVVGSSSTAVAFLDIAPLVLSMQNDNGAPSADANAISCSAIRMLGGCCCRLPCIATSSIA